CSSDLVLPLFMIAIGVEIAVNLVLNLYRPRMAGEQPRPAFESRILGLLIGAGGVATTLREAFRYQFGFEISGSWFWRLFGRALAPLILVGAAVLWLLT